MYITYPVTDTVSIILDIWLSKSYEEIKARHKSIAMVFSSDVHFIQ